MPTFPSPVLLSEFKIYLKDQTVDPAILSFYQSLLEVATEKVYTYLGRDYTPNAQKTDIFWGKDLHVHRMQNPAGTLISWKYYDEKGIETISSISDLVLFANGEIVVTATKKFERGLEHRLKYTLPPTLLCPETVKQVITEIAALIFEESKQGSGRLGVITETERGDFVLGRMRYIDLTDKQIAMLAPYKRYAI